MVAEELHFSRAAQRLGIAQPPLSQQIRRLEERIGHPLFVRGTRRVELTAAGRSLLATSRRLLEEAAHGIDAARRAGRGETGRLRVGFPTSMALTILSLIIRSYRSRYPNVDLQLRELATTQQLEALQTGSIDIGFLRSPRVDSDLVCETIFVEEFVAVLPRAHRLARRREISVSSLAQDPFVLFPRAIGREFYDQIVHLCRDAGFVPAVVQEASEWQTIAALIEAGLGVSIAPSCITRVHLDDVVYLPLTGNKSRTEVAMCWRPGSTEPLAEQFRKVAREMAPAGFAAPQRKRNVASKRPPRRGRDNR